MYYFAKIAASLGLLSALFGVSAFSPAFLKNQTLSFLEKIANPAQNSLNLEADSDHDGLSDAKEIFYQTDPKNPDTDGDGKKDGEEIENLTNPLIPGPNDKILPPSLEVESQQIAKNQNQQETSLIESKNDLPTLDAGGSSTASSGGIIECVHSQNLCCGYPIIKGGDCRTPCPYAQTGDSWWAEDCKCHCGETVSCHGEPAKCEDCYDIILHNPDTFGQDGYCHDDENFPIKEDHAEGDDESEF